MELMIAHNRAEVLNRAVEDPTEAQREKANRFRALALSLQEAIFQLDCWLTHFRNQQNLMNQQSQEYLRDELHPGHKIPQYLYRFLRFQEARAIQRMRWEQWRRGHFFPATPRHWR